MRWFMFDLLFFAVIALSTAFAVLRGGLQELSTLAALAIAGGLAWIVAPPLLGALGMAGSFFAVVAAAAVLVGVFFILAHVGLYLLLKRMPLSGRGRLANQIGGGAFGFVRGLALIGLGYLGYSYYLDVDRQPEEVRNAFTQPVAHALADFFEGFAPASTELDGIGAPAADGENAARDGYNRADRSSLDEIVTTVTTTGDAPATPPDGSSDDIADLLQSEDE